MNWRCDLIEAYSVQESKATDQQQEWKDAYTEAKRHGGEHDGYLGVEVDNGRNPAATLASVEGAHYICWH